MPVASSHPKGGHSIASRDAGVGANTIRTTLGMAVLLSLALALRVARLHVQELRGDEAFGYFFSLHPFPDIVQRTITLQEPHPVANYFVQKTWLGLAGHSEFSLRFVSVWFGVLAVVLLYRLARQLAFSRVTSMLGATLLAVSPYAVWHSQDARMYTMSLALTIASTWLAVRVVNQPAGRSSWPAWLGYVLTTWLALQTHYYTAFILLAQNVFVATTLWRRSDARIRLTRWVSSQVTVALLYLPWLYLVRDVIAGYEGNGDSPGFIEMWLRSLSVFAVGETIPASYRPLIAVLSIVLVLIGLTYLVRADGSRRRAAWLLLLYLAVPLLATWYSARTRPIFNERYLIAAAPPFYLLLARALPVDAWRQRRISVGAVSRLLVPALLLAAVLTGGVTSLHRYYTDPDYSKTRGWRALAEQIAQVRGAMPADRVRIAQNFPDPTLWYYYTGPVEHVVLPPAAHDDAGAGRVVDELVSAGVRWVLMPEQQTPLWDESGIAASALEEEYNLVSSETVGNWPLHVFARVPPDEMEPLSVSFLTGVTLRRVALQPETIVPGGMLVIHIDWAGSADRLAGTEKLFVHLVPAETTTPVIQVDPLFTADMLRQPFVSFGMRVPDALPAGRYRVLVGMYDPGQDGAPRIQTEVGGDHVEVGTVHTPR